MSDRPATTLVGIELHTRDDSHARAEPNSTAMDPWWHPNSDTKQDPALVSSPMTLGKVRLQEARDTLGVETQAAASFVDQWTRDVDIALEDDDFVKVDPSQQEPPTRPRRVSMGELIVDQLFEDESLMASIANAAAAAEECSTSTCTSSPSTTSSSSAVDDESGLTPLEIRRKRNRESMQRARNRQRDDIGSMKVTLQQLQAHFQKLNDQKDQQNRIRKDAATTTTSTGATTTAIPVAAAQSMDQVEVHYRMLAEVSRRLKEEKFLLEKMITEKLKTFRRLEQAMIDRKTECGIDTPILTESDAQTGLTKSLTGLSQSFSPITEQQADDAIKQCYEDIVRLEKLSKPLRNTAAAAATTTAPPLVPPVSTFGWLMMCHLLPEDSGFFVAFTKSFPDVTPDDVMLKTWTVFSRPEYNAGTENRSGAGGGLRMETLQVVNENAYVASRDVPHPAILGKTLRTVFLRFRLQTEQGAFVIGRACMNPTNAELRALEEEEANVVYGDFSSWIEFRSVSDGSSSHGCEVKFGALLAFDSQEDMQLRLINALMTTIVWETAVIKPVFSLQD